ncbi:hypothetical protein [Flavobacterium macacae]|uniref:Uma2 family endonuclease n=1 Tax=Flavobacterium macacae TaxID=2488993 RepID=A0A3P3W1L9_9FLAO|nr:hypothetical protein [Flavobacterium macacae]RRJ87786.1 hypothetical protein EG849_15090 [Flavobacterium macacae]
MDKFVGLTGPGNDFNHQAIISCLVHAFMDKIINKKTYKNYIAMPEFSLQPDSAQIPDIAIWKKVKKEYVPVVLIEICWTNKVEADIQKLKKHMEAIPTIREIFVIDKQNLEVKRINRLANNKPSTAKKISTVDTFSMKLDKILAIVPIR